VQDRVASTQKRVLYIAPQATSSCPCTKNQQT
jgi:hypothetical protein